MNCDNGGVEVVFATEMHMVMVIITASSNSQGHISVVEFLEVPEEVPKLTGILGKALVGMKGQKVPRWNIDNSTDTVRT